MTPTRDTRRAPPACANHAPRQAACLALVIAFAFAAWPTPARAQAVDCAHRKIHCVDDTAGPMQEFETIQAAVQRARKGHTVVVAAGEYAGFRVARSGKQRKRIVVEGQPGARIVAPEPGSPEGIYIEASDYVTIRGFEVDGSGGMHYGIAARDASAARPMHGLEVLDNIIHGTASTGLYLSHVADSLAEGNVVYGAGEHGIYLTNAGSDDTTLRGNECYENAVNGIHFNGDIRQGGDGIHTGLMVEANALHHNAANGIDADGVRDSTFRNNVIFDNGRHGLRAFAIDAAAGPAGLVIVNNTMADNASWAVKLTQDDGGHVIFNNILLSQRGSLVVDHEDLVSEHNVVLSAFSLDGEDNVLSLSSWRALGHDLASVRSKARKVFRSPGDHDYSLRAKSPARDLGVGTLAGVVAPETDVLGTPRPVGATRAAGAYEVQE